MMRKIVSHVLYFPVDVLRRRQNDQNLKIVVFRWIDDQYIHVWKLMSFLTVKNNIDNIHTGLSIKSDTGQYSQFLPCFKFALSKKLVLKGFAQSFDQIVNQWGPLAQTSIISATNIFKFLLLRFSVCSIIWPNSCSAGPAGTIHWRPVQSLTLPSLRQIIPVEFTMHKILK